MPIIVKCAGCGKSIKRWPRDIRRSKEHYCSVECKNKAHQTVLTCPICGIQFKVKLSRKDRRATCSKECLKIHLSRLQQEHPNTPRDRITKNCPVCGVSFETVPSTERRFCSRSCADKAISLGLTHRRKPHLIDLICEQCGQQFQVQPYAAKTQRFCSLVCKYEWQGPAMSGENHPLWKGGRAEYYGSNWKRQRREARRRDGHVCQHCGITEQELGRALDVHHIKPFKEFGLENHNQANKLSNLISLCTSCHSQAEPNGPLARLGQLPSMGKSP